MALNPSRLQRTIDRRIRQNRKHIAQLAEEKDPVLRDLFSVMTVHEAAARFDKHRNTVRQACIEGKLNYRASGQAILITTESLIRLWGPPVPPDLGSVQLILPLWKD